MGIDTLSEQIATVQWYHCIELPGGIVTPGRADNLGHLKYLHLPPSLEGKTVLDVGAWDGYYSFEAARRGAARVVALDSYGAWANPDGFYLARRALGLESKVEHRVMDLMGITPEGLGGRFDLVLFLGVLYHLKNPLEALEKVASVCGDMLLMETEIALDWLPYPAARLYVRDELGGSGDNWFAFSGRALEGLLKELGFSRIDVIHRTGIIWRLIGSARLAFQGKNFRRSFRSSRIVLHARR